MSAQLHVMSPSWDGPAPTAEIFDPVAVIPDLPRDKPSGGFWTSTYLGDHGSGWTNWCLGEQFDCSRDNPRWRAWLLHPCPGARVYVIDTLADLHALVNRFYHERRYPSGHISAYPHWERVAEEYDGVRLTEEGVWRTRLTFPTDLYGWDCESTLWLRWAFDRVEDLGVQRFPAADPWWEPEEVAA